MTKKIYILRGLPGSGKNFWINRFIKHYQGIFGKIFGEYSQFFECSADKYFYRPDCRYDWNPKLLNKAHQWCFNEFKRALDNQCPVIFVNNTNITRQEWMKYSIVALEYHYQIKVVMVGKLTEDFIKLCSARNLHNVPYSVIYNMANRFEL
jgi:predicted kinase